MKKVVCIILAVLLVIGAAVTGLVFLLKAKHPAKPDIHKTPIPQTLDVSSAPTATDMSESPVNVSDATEKSDADSAMLFGVRYPAEIYRSKKTYLSPENLEAAVQRKTFYKDSDGSVIYTSLIEKETMAVYDTEQLVYFSGAFKPETDYLTEPVHWFYKDGKLACAELCFYDGDNNGTAYYTADGALLCIRTELYTAGKDGAIQMSNTFYDSSFAEITEEAFTALLPQIDEPSFLSVNMR